MIFLRSLAFNIWFYCATAGWSLASLGPRALPGAFSPNWALRLALAWSRTVTWGMPRLIRTRFEVTGREHLPTSGAALIASNHQSAFDTLVWFMLVPRPCYVLKRELRRIPLFGPLCHLTGMITVDRGGGANAIRSLLREADRAVREQRQIVIFPEGTRMPLGAPLVLQPGIAALASRTHLPVIPVATDSGFCWGRRAFRKRPGVIRIAVLPPLPADLPRDELMRRLHHDLSEGMAALERERAGGQAGG